MGVMIFSLQDAILKTVSGGHAVTLATSPGVEFLQSRPTDQTLGAVTMRGSEPNATFGALDLLEASELLRDLEMLTR